VVLGDFKSLGVAICDVQVVTLFNNAFEMEKWAWITKGKFSF
jgi:hypothetical protein